MTQESLLISVADLAGRSLDNQPVLLDVQWQLQGPPGRTLYDRGHLPGARFVDLDTALAGPPSPTQGRHPLPEPGVLQGALRAAGVSDGSDVVVYDGSGGLSAARAWWVLRWAGLPSVRLLDGGLRAWQAAGHPLVTDVPEVAAGNFSPRPGGMPVLSADEAAALAVSGVLLDARAGERYRGEVEPLDPRAGHIPGAVSAPTTENIGPSHQFRSPSELSERFAALGVSADSAVGVYCGSGVTAAHQIFALALTGQQAALYPGSWSQWSSDPNREVATGPA